MIVATKTIDEFRLLLEEGGESTGDMVFSYELEQIGWITIDEFKVARPTSAGLSAAYYLGLLEVAERGVPA